VPAAVAPPAAATTTATATTITTTTTTTAGKTMPVMQGTPSPPLTSVTTANEHS